MGFWVWFLLTWSAGSPLLKVIRREEGHGGDFILCIKEGLLLNVCGIFSRVMVYFWGRRLLLGWVLFCGWGLVGPTIP